MIIDTSQKIECGIGATIKIQYGTTMSDFVQSSKEAAREVLSESESLTSDGPRTPSGDVVSDLY